MAPADQLETDVVHAELLRVEVLADDEELHLGAEPPASYVDIRQHHRIAIGANLIERVVGDSRGIFEERMEVLHK